MKSVFTEQRLSGVVFDIQRFALHDGPGIRTTVFLKGCPLRCLWCSNPESQNPQPQLAFLAQNCTHCTACVSVCPHNAHIAVDGRHHWLNERCRACFQCVEACAHNALRKIGEPMSVEQVMAIVRKDRRYYEKTGGGLTLSGGEPTFQADFAFALLQQAKTEAFHTCMETAGCAAPEILEKFIAVVDLFLFDLKLFDERRHHHFVGSSLQPILANLRILAAYNAPTVLRCPIVPGVNDDDAHFTQIAALRRELPNIQSVEIMPYHDFGRSKAADIGRSDYMNQPSATTEQVQQWRERMTQLKS